MNNIAKKTNLTGIFFTLFIFTIIIVGYIVEVLRGDRGLGSVLFLGLSALLIYGTVYFIYRQDAESKRISYILVLGFLLPYGYTLWTTVSLIAFAFITPVFVIAFMFFERKLVTILTISVLIMNIFFVRRMIGLGAYSDGTDLLLTITILGTLLIASSFVGYFNEQMIQNITRMLEEEQQYTQEKEELVKEIQEFSSTLVSSAQELTATSQEGSAVAEEMSKAIEDVAEGVSDQAIDVESGLLVVNDIEDLLGEELASIRALHSDVEEIERMKEEGTATLTTLLNETAIHDQAIAAITNNIIQTEKSGQEIEKVVDMIANIAEQTNLLALNAAIEAARAGDAGRGFAVVADEIRSLAEESRQFADQINGIINGLTQNTTTVVNTMDEVTTISKEQGESIQQTSEKFTQIDQAVRQIQKSMEELNRSSQAVGERKNEMVTLMQNLAEVAEQNASGTEEISASIEEQTAGIEQSASTSDYLASLAIQLDQSISSF